MVARILLKYWALWRQLANSKQYIGVVDNARVFSRIIFQRFVGGSETMIQYFVLNVVFGGSRWFTVWLWCDETFHKRLK